MPESASHYEEIQLLSGACGALLRLAQRYKPHPLPGDKPHYAPDKAAEVRHIKLALALDIPNKSINGACSTTLAPINDGLATVEFDAVELDIQSVTLEGGGALPFEVSADKLRVALAQPRPAGQPFTLVVRYSATPRRGLYFVGPDAAYPDKPAQVWSQGQDEDSRHWFPCHDFPNQKATSEMIVTVPEQLYALSNGVLVESRPGAAGTRTFHWRQEVPHSCYLITLAVGDFAEIQESADGVPVLYYVQRGREEEARRALGNTPDMIRFFSQKLGVPYPYNKYAQVFVADFIFGGMENTTATTLTDTVLHDERAHLDYSADSLVAHELAHQWFGDLLTCRDWANGWLNEGFATYFDALYKQHHEGEDEFRYWMRGVAQTYFSEDPGHYRRPLVSNVYHEPIDIFDRHLYEKGSLVLHMIRYLLGDDLFWKSLNHYLTKHHAQNVVSLDLQRAIEEATGRNLEWFFQQWVHSAGYPEFKVDYAWDDALKAAKLTVAQNQAQEEQTPVFRMPVDVEFTTATGAVLRRVEVSEKEHTFYLPLPEKPLAVRFDPQGWVLKSLEFTRPKELLLHQLQHAPDALGRVEAAQGLGKLGSPEAIQALGDALLGDAFWGVQAEAARALGSIRSQAALDALLQGVAIPHPKARRAVAQALGEFRDEAAATALASLAQQGDTSYFVEAEAGRALGKTRSTEAFSVLERAMEKPSHSEIIRALTLDGFAELADVRAIPIAREWTRYGQPQPARSAAIAALGKLAKYGAERDKEEIRDTLVQLLNDGWLRVKLTTIGALEELKDTRAIPALERLAAGDLDGRVQRRAREAASAIRQGQDKGEEIKKLRDDTDRVLKENRELRDRLDKLEAKVNGGGGGDGVQRS
ncbi:MAG: HEAT repeat domain-containing protein [Chloroflexi bacterium]|nr:HEAT repeat domain-containing protein [Chloroflexota bacterium]